MYNAVGVEDHVGRSIAQGAPRTAMSGLWKLNAVGDWRRVQQLILLGRYLKSLHHCAT
jgi:hypothetical protein